MSAILSRPQCVKTSGNLVWGQLIGKMSQSFKTVEWGGANICTEWITTRTLTTSNLVVSKSLQLVTHEALIIYQISQINRGFLCGDKPLQYIKIINVELHVELVHIQSSNITEKKLRTTSTRRLSNWCLSYQLFLWSKRAMFMNNFLVISWCFSRNAPKVVLSHATDTQVKEGWDYRSDNMTQDQETPNFPKHRVMNKTRKIPVRDRSPI